VEEGFRDCVSVLDWSWLAALVGVCRDFLPMRVN
jgi:hypothetical protein